MVIIGKSEYQQSSFTPLIHTYKERPLVGEDRVMKVASGQPPLARYTPRARIEKREAIHPDTEGRRVACGGARVLLLAAEGGGGMRMR